MGTDSRLKWALAVLVLTLGAGVVLMRPTKAATFPLPVSPETPKAAPVDSIPAAVLPPSGSAPVDAGKPDPERDAGSPVPQTGAPVVMPLSAAAEARRTASARLRTRAGLLVKTKQWKVALPLFELAERFDPDSPESAERLGAAYARNGESTRAVYFYNRFLELAPTDPLANDLKEDVDSWLKDHPDPALELMREGVMRPLNQAEADLQTELARRMTNTSDPDADLEWFLAEVARRRDAGR